MIDLILIATHNQHKVREIQDKLVLKGIRVLSLSDVNDAVPIEETGSTFQENALIKARHACFMHHIPSLADDSGLLVEALDGAPGVHSARYSIEQTDEANNRLLLERLNGIKHRKARFVSVLAYVTPQGEEVLFEGILEGEIATIPAGTNGFGYDPIFYLPELHCMLSELTLSEKNQISHRAKSLSSFIDYIGGTI
jgi:XTP/dITP diphosphohydrolase